MIFKTEAENFHLFESYKERNLYYKIIGGYLLNEIIEGYEERKEKLLGLLLNIRKDEERFIDPFNKAQIVFEALQKETWDITFDYHIVQILQSEIVDRGEMSDILLLTKSSLVSFECKYPSDFNIDKDIHAVQDRITQFYGTTGRTPLQVLLLKKDKWHYSSKIKTRLSCKPESINIPIIVLFWEELIDIIDDYRVKNFLNKQIQRASSPAAYRSISLGRRRM